MTQEEKARAYDEAKARMSRAWNDNRCTLGFMNEIFPELKESEDEKIRKALVRFHKSTIDVDGIKGEDILAWLEKQGEQKVPSVEFKAKDWYVSNVDGKIHDMTYNPTDKVEPKFHEGDWIVNDYCSGKVIALTDDAYLLDSGQGIPFSCEHNVHLWTIADAKDGDVLVDDLGNICIYQESSTKFMYHSYCYGKHNYFVDRGGSHEIVDTCPATKEQRDTLFKAMHEAGYEWDTEKKELKKIEQKPVNDTIETIVEAVSNTSILDMIEDKDAFTNPSAFENSLGRLLKLFEKLPKQDLLDGLKFYSNVVEHDGEYVKPTEWSEDDERIITALMEGFRYHQLFNPRFGEVPNAEIISWIKSLKERLS